MKQKFWKKQHSIKLKKYMEWWWREKYRKKRQLEKLKESITDPITRVNPVVEPIPRGDEKNTKLWAELVKKHHPLPYRGGMGRYIRFFVKDANNGEILGCASLGSAVLYSESRDKYIGWNKEQRLRNLNKIANNRRFLILTHVKVPNLASKVLSLLEKEGKKEWEKRYGDPLVLLETFVEPNYLGTCYKAANWKFIGYTKGFIHYVPTVLKKSEGGGARTSRYVYTGEKKAIFVRSLDPNWKEKLLR
jgi:hypothetical protein